MGVRHGLFQILLNLWKWYDAIWSNKSIQQLGILPPSPINIFDFIFLCILFFKNLFLVFNIFLKYMFNLIYVKIIPATSNNLSLRITVSIYFSNILTIKKKNKFSLRRVIQKKKKILGRYFKNKYDFHSHGFDISEGDSRSDSPAPFSEVVWKYGRLIIQGQRHHAFQWPHLLYILLSIQNNLQI